MHLKVIGSGSLGNAYLLTSSKGETLMIECGIKFRYIKEALKFDLGGISGCILTHEHKDHSKALVDVINAGIDVYASPGTIEKLAVVHRRFKPVEPKKPFNVGSFQIIAFDAKHDCAQPYGFLIKHEECGTVLFITDSSFVEYKFPGLNNVIVEANYCLDKIQQKAYDGKILSFLHDRVIQSHMSVQTAEELLQANDLSAVHNIVLIHLSDSNSDAVGFQKRIHTKFGKKTFIAEKALHIPFTKTPF